MTWFRMISPFFDRPKRTRQLSHTNTHICEDTLLPDLRSHSLAFKTTYKYHRHSRTTICAYMWPFRACDELIRYFYWFSVYFIVLSPWGFVFHITLFLSFSFSSVFNIRGSEPFHFHLPHFTSLVAPLIYFQSYPYSFSWSHCSSWSILVPLSSYLKAMYVVVKQ